MTRSLLIITLALVCSGTQAQYLADNHRPDPADELYKAGEKAYRAGDNPLAIELFSRALEARPDHVNAHLQRGFCHSLMKNYEKAIADFSAVIELKPEHYWA